MLGDSVVLPPSMREWILSQPERHLSTTLAQRDVLNSLTTFLSAQVALTPNPQPIRNLAVHQEAVAHQMSEEVELALTDLLGRDSEQFRNVNIDFVVRRVIARTVSRVFVGPELCKLWSLVRACISILKLTNHRLQ